MLPIVDPWQAAALALPAGISIFAVIRHFWPVFLVLSFVNAASWWWHARQEIVRNPSLAWRYGRLICQILIVSNVPWLIFGAAVELPATFPVLPTLPIFIASIVTFVVSWGISFYWIYFRGGAEILVYRFDAIIPRHPIWVKIAFVSMVGGTVALLAPIYWFTVAQ